MNWAEILPILGMGLTVIGTGASVIGFVYAIMRNFKIDVNAKMDSLEKRLEDRMNRLDERMFLLSTGKSLADAIKEERMKKVE